MLTPMSIREGDSQSQCPGWAQGTPGVTEQTNHSCLASSSPSGHPDILDIANSRPSFVSRGCREERCLSLRVPAVLTSPACRTHWVSSTDVACWEGELEARSPLSAPSLTSGPLVSCCPAETG